MTVDRSGNNDSLGGGYGMDKQHDGTSSSGSSGSKSFRPPPAYPAEVEYDVNHEGHKKSASKPITDLEQLNSLLEEREESVTALMLRDISRLEGSQEDYETLRSYLDQNFDQSNQYESDVPEFGGVLYGERQGGMRLSQERKVENNEL